MGRRIGEKSHTTNKSSKLEWLVSSGTRKKEGSASGGLSSLVMQGDWIRDPHADLAPTGYWHAPSHVTAWSQHSLHWSLDIASPVSGQCWRLFHKRLQSPNPQLPSTSPWADSSLYPMSNVEPTRRPGAIGSPSRNIVRRNAGSSACPNMPVSSSSQVPSAGSAVPQIARHITRQATRTEPITSTWCDPQVMVRG